VKEGGGVQRANDKRKRESDLFELRREAKGSETVNYNCSTR
jgi:hypothetical protein